MKLLPPCGRLERIVEAGEVQILRRCRGWKGYPEAPRAASDAGCASSPHVLRSITYQPRARVSSPESEIDGIAAEVASPNHLAGLVPETVCLRVSIPRSRCAQRPGQIVHVKPSLPLDALRVGLGLRARDPVAQRMRVDAAPTPGRERIPRSASGQQQSTNSRGPRPSSNQRASPRVSQSRALCPSGRPARAGRPRAARREHVERARREST